MENLGGFEGGVLGPVELELMDLLLFADMGSDISMDMLGDGDLWLWTV